MSRFVSALERGYDMLTSSRMRCLAVTFVLCTFLFTLMNAAWRPSSLNDDWAISLTLFSGEGGVRQLSLFVSPLLSAFIASLNQVLPSTNWFFVAELTCAYCAYFVLSYLVFRHSERLVACATFGFLSLVVLPQISYLSNFTMVAAICCAAGAYMLFLYLMGEAERKLMVIVGVLFLTMGAMWRWKVLLLSMPAFGIATVVILFILLKRTQEPRNLFKRIIPIVVSMVVFAGVYAHCQYAYTGDELRSWYENRTVMSQIDDYPLNDYDDVAEELASVGVSKNDFSLLQAWISEDPEFFTTNRVAHIADIARVRVNGFDAVSVGLNSYFDSLLDWHFQLAFIGVMLVALCRAGGRRMLSAVLALLCLSFVLSVYFTAAGRLPIRVHDAIWLASYIAALAVVTCGQGKVEQKHDLDRRGLFAKLVTIAYLILPVVACAGVIYVGFSNFAPERLLAVADSDRFDARCSTTDYMEEHPDEVFVFTVYSNYDVKSACMLRAYPPWAYRERAVMLGGWDARSPYMMEKNERLGMSNPIKGLVDNDHARLVFQPDQEPKRILTYLREHYYPHARCEVVDVIEDSERYGTLDVYRFYNE